MQFLIKYGARVLLGFCLLLAPVNAYASEDYATQGDCDGFPKLPLQTRPGLCVGLVATHLGFARGIAVLDGMVYVADMKGWGQNGKGRLLRIDMKSPARTEAVLTHLDQPNAVVASGHGTLYVGSMGKILEYDPKSAAGPREAVIHLPTDGRHPLPALVVASDGALFINVGSLTNNCERENDETAAAPDPCPETSGALPRGAIIRVMPEPAGAVDVTQGEVVARGLRNSMALGFLPHNQLVAAVNARDNINQADPKLSDEALPHDTLDWIEKGADYGWPYCYDYNLASPEYSHFDCSVKHIPTLLLPAHAAPLGLWYYTDSKLSELTGRLIIPYHGYRKAGHRIVALALDAQHRPQGPPIDIVWDWDAVHGTKPLGAPVGIAALPDGSLLITEDHNGTLLRLSRSKP